MGGRSRQRRRARISGVGAGSPGRKKVVAAGAAAIATLGILAAVAVVAFSAFAAESDGRPRAIIIDQLAATDPNPAFVFNAAGFLAAAGYAVDYVPPEDVTVDLYRDLPAHGHELVILRTHAASSGRALLAGDRTAGGPVAEPWDEVERGVSIFTNEPFTPERHVRDQDAGRLARNLYFDAAQGGRAYFGIIPEFVMEAMRGTFPGSTVVLMGCDGLESTVMAEAFAARGAGDFVSWSDLVTAEHTDKATEQFLRHLLLEGRSTVEAVGLTMAEIGPDPVYGGLLMIRPAQ
jgi:hypothetical protein